MKLLALDYGTKTGFSYGDISNEFPETAGTWTLGTAKEIKGWGLDRRTRRCDPRIQRLAEQLRRFPLADYVVFEDVQFASSGAYQVQLWASLRTVAWLEYPPNVVFECVSVGALKKRATGVGNATKEQMVSAFNQHPHRASLPADLDHNAADAVFIWLWGKQNLARRA